MADPGQFTLNSDGQFFLNADGSWAVLNGAGECPACCGGSGGGANPICLTQHPLQHTFVCPLNSQTTTVALRNSWSDNFSWPTPSVWPNRNFPVPPPCDNYSRLDGNTWGSGASHSLMAANVLNQWGGAGRLGIYGGNNFADPTDDAGGYHIKLWNGGGTSVVSRMQITLCRSVGQALSNLYFNRPVQIIATAATMNTADWPLPRLLGPTFGCAFVGLVPNWYVDNVLQGPTEYNDRLTIDSTTNVESPIPSYARYVTSVSWSIVGGETGRTLSGTYSRTTDNFLWLPSQLPQLCGVFHMVGFINGSGYTGGILDDYSGQVFNPVHVLP